MSTWSPASILNLKMNIENEGAAGRIFLFIYLFIFFEIWHFKMDEE